VSLLSGNSYLDIENNPEALKCFDSAIKADPTDPSAYYNKGVVYSKLGKRDEAVVWYYKCIDKDPNYSRAYNNLGKGILCIFV
jgi:tetratricopeptide (TPR) repeat protein